MPPQTNVCVNSYFRTEVKRGLLQMKLDVKFKSLLIDV
jgi:hypothetical protein